MSLLLLRNKTVSSFGLSLIRRDVRPFSALITKRFYPGFSNVQFVTGRSAPKITPRTTTTTSRRHASSNTPQFPHPINPPQEPDYDFFKTLHLLFVRGAMAASWVYVMTEYCIDITMCEGPSMDPTIRSAGEIILMDKWNVRRFGLADGSEAEQRAAAARRRQEKEEERQGRTTKNSENIFWHQPRISVTDLEQHQPLSWRGAWKHMRSPLSVGDVVVVEHSSRKGTVCKRVMGLPGDQVILSTLNSRSQHLGGNTGGSRQLLVVPNGHLWLEGDNPSNSSDSRDYGPVPAALVVGRVLARIWPLRGSAWMRRGAPPRRPGVSSASTILPAGYEGQQIIKHLNDGKEST